MKQDSGRQPIGFLGVGAIGQPIAEHILAGHSLIVCDVSEKALSRFHGRVSIANSPAQVASEAETVFACLPTLQSYRDAILGPGGLIEGTRVRSFIQIGTTGPDLAKTMDDALSKRGIASLDAPVSGGTPRARSGTLTVMTSGPRELFDRCEHLLRTFASKVVYLGSSVGSAQTMKLINNLLSASNLAVASEMLVLGVKAGLDPEAMLEVLNDGTGQNSATLTKIPDHVLPRTFDYGGRLEVVYKDLQSLLHEAELLGVATPLSALTNETYRIAMARGAPTDDMTAVIRHMEQSANVLVGGKRTTS